MARVLQSNKDSTRKPGGLTAALSCSEHSFHSSIATKNICMLYTYVVNTVQYKIAPLFDLGQIPETYNLCI